MADTGIDQPLTNFDLFVLGLSALSLLNIALVLAPLSDPVTNVVLIIDGVLCIVFLGDFLLRFKRAPVKRAYMIADKGWLDLLGSLPFPGLRLARILRVVRSSRAVDDVGIRGIWRRFSADRAGSALLGTLFLAIIVLQFGSMLILGAEADKENTNIKSASDALWWSYVTVTTVGYGDRFPVTNQGRLVGVAMLTIGIGLFGVLTGFLTNAFLAPRQATPDQRIEDSSDIRVEIEEIRRLVRELGEQVADRREDNG
ncbi:MAG TPA: ion transporter [Thermomicrobiales bacterium]|nr:ion transporter [Thermomicrobiales bacterium]